jgi:hypothetical protein
MLAASVLVATSLGAPDRKAPRIVRAAMQDADRDGRADRVVLTFSERIRHAADRDRTYPLTVAGYKVLSIGPARGRKIVLRLVEKASTNATPAVRYRHTTSKPVRDRAGNQAVGQVFRRVRPLAGGAATPLPPPAPPPPPPDPTLPPDTDPDRDGYAAPQDCEPNDAAAHPGAEDLPDLAFVDTNCDGIDGDEAKAVFVSPQGNDNNTGTKAQPKREIQAAVLAGSLTGRYVLAAGGDYTAVQAATGVSIYGGYDPASWARSNDQSTAIIGPPQGVLADGDTNVTLQLLTVRGVSPGGANGQSAYGIRAISGSSLRLQRVTVLADGGSPGAAGANGAAGRPGSAGQNGTEGAADADVDAPGGAGGDSIVARTGGKGGDGRYESDGQGGETGRFGTPGGAGGDLVHGLGGNEGRSGDDGQDGSQGAPGAVGPGGDASTVLAGVTWQGRGGIDGIYGAPGNGGGGGGGGGGQTGYFVINGTGSGGGGGGGGGEGGRGGGGGRAGGGSFGVYLYNSSIVVEGSSIAAGNGGAGGRGGNGGKGGDGGRGGTGGDGTYETGWGGNGGRGGNGGQGGGGGGGAGGPSIRIYKAGTSTATVTDSTVTGATPGAGGGVGNGGTGPGGTGATGIAASVYPA